MASDYHQLQVEKRQGENGFHYTIWFVLVKLIAICLISKRPGSLLETHAKGYGHLFNILLVNLDDLLVFSPTFEEHLKRLQKVVDRLRELNVKLNPDKCKLGSSSVSFLGHVLPRDGLKTDPDKIAAVKNIPQPTTVRDVRAFIGLAGYYRRFVKNFASLAKHLHQLLTTSTKKDRNPRVNWT